MPATIKDIAARLGVSHSTVSRALRGFPYVNEELRRKVRETAEELHYRPNALARGLKGMRTRVVGLIVPDLMNDFYASAATIMQGLLAAEGYRLLLSVSGNDLQTELAYLHAMLEERVEGLVWVPLAANEGVIREYAGQGVPVIQFSRQVTDRLDAVLPDNEGGAEMATGHLLALGHRRIGLVVGQVEMSSGRARLDGYLRAFRRACVEVDADLIMAGRFERAWGKEATERLLDLPSPPSALLAASSELLIGALQSLDARRVPVPEGLSLVGFGNPDWYGVWRPPITTVAYSTEELATSAARNLLRRIGTRAAHDTSEPALIHFGCRLVERGSTAPRFHP